MQKSTPDLRRATVCRPLIPTLTEEETEAGIEEILQTVGDPTIKDYSPDQPRDERGRFTTGGGGRKFDRTRKYPPILGMSRSEIARFFHAMNTDLSNEQRKQRIIVKYIGDHKYVVENLGFGQYNILERTEIE